MQPIKFRAWDKERNKWLDDASWLGHFDDFYFTDINSVFEDFDKDIVLMQFTGLLDKNGREIYEGDIVDAPGHYGVGQVLWGVDHDGGWVLKDKPNSIPGAFFLGHIPDSDMEVIGNIYENPELLK